MDSIWIIPGRVKYRRETPVILQEDCLTFHFACGNQPRAMCSMQNALFFVICTKKGVLPPLKWSHFSPTFHLISPPKGSKIKSLLDFLFSWHSHFPLNHHTLELTVHKSKYTKLIKTLMPPQLRFYSIQMLSTPFDHSFVHHHFPTFLDLSVADDQWLNPVLELTFLHTGHCKIQWNPAWLWHLLFFACLCHSA